MRLISVVSGWRKSGAKTMGLKFEAQSLTMGALSPPETPACQIAGQPNSGISTQATLHRNTRINSWKTHDILSLVK